MSPTVLTRLREEHRRFRELLDILARQFDSLDAGCQPDIAVMVDLLDHLSGVTQRHHEHFEDQLLNRLIARAPRHGPVVAALRDRRRRALARGGQMLAMAKAVQDGNIACCDPIVRAGRHFVSRFRTLLYHEENGIFPLLVESLQPSDWVEITTHCHWLCGMQAEPWGGGGYAMVAQRLHQRASDTSPSGPSSVERCPVCDYG